MYSMYDVDGGYDDDDDDDDDDVLVLDILLSPSNQFQLIVCKRFHVGVLLCTTNDAVWPYLS